MNISQWCQISESIHIAEEDERFKQYAGLDYSPSIIEELAEQKSINARMFLDNFCEPRELFLLSLKDIAESNTKKLELKLYDLRNEKIRTTKKQHQQSTTNSLVLFGKSPVNWSTWRQFNAAEKDDKKRKQVFDEFILKTRYIAPVIKKRFDEIGKSYAKYSHKKVDPLDAYLEEEKFNNYSELVDFVKSLGNQAKKPFKEALADISKKVLKRDAEYYDDFYFFRNRLFDDMGKYFTKINALDKVMHTLQDMQFDLSHINIDAEDRKNKYPSPMCSFIQVPHDIRVLYKRESPYFEFHGCYHEMGHAIHASSIDPNLTYWDRYGFSMGIAEIFSIFLERLTRNRKYLSSIAGIDDERVLEDITARNNFMDLFFVTFYSANSLMKAEFWKKKLSIEKASSLYAKLIKEYTGFDLPGEYWMLHHILPDAVMYVPSYLVAAIRAAELDNRLQNTFGETWWRESEAGRYLRGIMSQGAKIDLNSFSKLDPKYFMEEIMMTTTTRAAT